MNGRRLGMRASAGRSVRLVDSVDGAHPFRRRRTIAAMDPLSRTSHEHHERRSRSTSIVFRRARRGASPTGKTPDGSRGVRGRVRFIVGQLVPHMEAIERRLYGRLEQLMEGRHSMAPMRQEHEELRRLIEELGRYREHAATAAAGARSRGWRSGARSTGSTRS